MAEGIVDALEIIQIEVQHRETAPILLGRLDGSDQTVARLLPVG